MARRRVRTPAQPANTRTCCFCGLAEDNEPEFGKFHEHDGIVTHYYCLLLSSNMEQKGNDNEGILGFLKTDIQKELRRGKRLVCSYCKRNGATLGCCNTKCKKIFHFPCGLRAGSLHQFFDEFRSYCISHRPKQKIDDRVKREVEASGDTTCYICYENVNPHDVIGTLWAPCCRKNAWFHRLCIQQLATSAGYFFKCPLCNNRKDFLNAMQENGIFIPSQDASWELVPNAFQELLHRHDRCDAENCICPKGRKHASLNTRWDLILCRLCGSQGIHVGCGSLKWTNPVWECSDCQGMLKQPTDLSSSTVSAEQRSTSADYPSEQESGSDSQISVDRQTPLPPISEPEIPLSPVEVIKLKPGPRSFKLQQVGIASNSTRMETTERSATVERNGTFALSRMQTESIVPCVDKMRSSSMETGSSQEKSGHPATNLNKPSPDVIMIDSDDDIVEVCEVISERSKHNVLTTKDGTKIKIHNLYPAASNTWNVRGDVNVMGYDAPQRPGSVVVQKQSVDANTTVVGSNSIVQPIATRPTNQVYYQADPTLIGMLTGGMNNNTQIPQRMEKNKLQENNISDRETGIEASGDSLMNIKIVEVTSVAPELFAATPETPTGIENAGIHASSHPEFEYANVDELPVSQATPAPLSRMSEPRRTMFQLSTAAIKDISTKRKSDMAFMIDKNVLASPVGEVVDQCKRPRTGDDAMAPSSSSSSENMSWNLTLPGVNGRIPIIVTSLATSSHGNDSHQPSMKIVQSNIGMVQTTNILDERIASIANNQESSHLGWNTKHPDRIDTRNNSVYQVGSQHPPIGISYYGYRLPATSSGTPSFPKGYSKPPNQYGGQVFVRLPDGNSAQQKVLCGGQQSSIPGGAVSNVTSSNRGTLTSPSSSSGIFYTAVPEGYAVPIPSISGGVQANTGGAAQTPKQDGGLPVASGCDGDAGSGLAVGSGNGWSVEVRRCDETTGQVSSFQHEFDTSMEPSTRQSDGSRISPGVPSVLHNRPSISSIRSSRNRSRLIPRTVNLRDLKFHLSDADTLQVVVGETFCVKIDLHRPKPQSVRNATRKARSPRLKSEHLQRKEQQFYNTRSSKKSQTSDSIGSKKSQDDGISVQSATMETDSSDELQSVPSRSDSSNAKETKDIENTDTSESNESFVNCKTLPSFAFIEKRDKNSPVEYENSERSISSVSFEENCADPLREHVDSFYCSDSNDVNIIHVERRNGIRQEKERNRVAMLPVNEDVKENLDPIGKVPSSNTSVGSAKFGTRDKTRSYNFCGESSSPPNDDSDETDSNPLEEDHDEAGGSGEKVYRRSQINRINKSDDSDISSLDETDKNIKPENHPAASKVSGDDCKFNCKVIRNSNASNRIKHWDYLVSGEAIRESVNSRDYKTIGNGVCDAGTLETLENGVETNKTKACIDEKLYKTERQQSMCVRVSIDLKRIRCLVDDKPDLLTNYNETKTDCANGKYDFASLHKYEFKDDFKTECKSESGPFLVKSQSLDNLNDKCSSTDSFHSPGRNTSKSIQNVYNPSKGSDALKQTGLSREMRKRQKRARKRVQKRLKSTTDRQVD